jgi:alpha-N-arabinofuranosidase
MANVAQLVNNLHSLFLADGDKFVATPTFHVFEMYRPHQQGQAVRVDVQAGEVAFRAGGKDERLFRVAGSASRKGKAVTLTLVHTHAAEPAEVAVRLKGGSADQVRRAVLTHKRLNAHNTFDAPKAVVPAASALDQKGSALRCVLPPASVTRLDIRLG